MTPELLWSLRRVSAVGLTDDGTSVIYKVTTYDIEANESSSSTYIIPLAGGEPEMIESYDDMRTDPKISPDGKHKLIAKDVKLNAVTGHDHHPDLDKSDAYIYDNLMYRHWDTWEDGKFSHVMIVDLESGDTLDIMVDEPYDCPTKPFGGSEDFTWSPDGANVAYATKKEFGTAYATSTNTDIYVYDVNTKATVNLTEGNDGYDTHPAFSVDGVPAWLQMDEPGYEADKNDIIIFRFGKKVNLTKDWDGTVSGFNWANNGKGLYFTAPIDGTKQLFYVNINGGMPRQITNGIFDVTGIVGEVSGKMVITRTDMNHATEIFVVDLPSGQMAQLTHENDDTYKSITLSNIQKRMVETTDGKEMLVWVIYPPGFDPEKKYPTLLYCQGGPQSQVSQFYSFRWNFQLMAAQGYIVVAPNRRGLPGFGVEWNEQISGDWGGQNMQDYLSAIDDVSKEPYVDKSKRGCVGASYGGYSAFYLAGMHEGRFKSFIAHDGVFNTRSMWGTTEEVFFPNKDWGGAYWQEPEPKIYNDFNPAEHVSKWDTPMLIIQGGKDYRVPIGQGLEAFQAAQLQGIKSRLLYFPDENHWILSAQNGLVWQREFFKWLRETLNTGSRS